VFELRDENKGAVQMTHITDQELAVITGALKDIQAVLGRIKKRKGMEVSLKKMKERGNTPGRKKTRDDEQIMKLRKRGLSMRAIAKLCGVSTTAVQRGIRSCSNEHR